MNFIVFVLHSITKIMLLVFTTLWWEPLRCELYQLLFALIILYILSSIKTAISKIKMIIFSKQRRYQSVCEIKFHQITIVCCNRSCCSFSFNKIESIFDVIIRWSRIRIFILFNACIVKISRALIFDNEFKWFLYRCCTIRFRFIPLLQISWFPLFFKR